MNKFVLILLIKIIIFNLFEFILVRKDFINYLLSILEKYLLNFKKIIFEIWNINFGF